MVNISLTSNKIKLQRSNSNTAVKAVCTQQHFSFPCFHYKAQIHCTLSTIYRLDVFAATGELNTGHLIIAISFHHKVTF